MVTQTTQPSLTPFTLATTNNMKGALIALLIGIVLLVGIYTRLDIYRRKSGIDIHLHDTYLVMSYASVVVFLLLFLGTFISVGGMIGSHFRSRLFGALVVLFLSVDTYYVVTCYKAFTNFKATSSPKE